MSEIYTSKYTGNEIDAKLDTIKNTGNGTKFLSDNGEYKEVEGNSLNEEQLKKQIDNYFEENPTDLTLITKYQYSKNLFNPKTDIDWDRTVQYGVKVDKTDAKVEDGSKWNWIVSTTYIEIEEGIEYICSNAYKSGAYDQIYLYDADKKYVGSGLENKEIGTDGYIHFKAKTGLNIKYFVSNINAYYLYGATSPYAFELRKVEKTNYKTTDWQNETTEFIKTAPSKKEVDVVAFVGQSNMTGLAWSNDFYKTSIILDDGEGYEFSFKNFKNGIDYNGCLKPAQNLFGIGDRYYSDDCNEANHIGGVQAPLMKEYYKITGTPMVGISCSTSGRSIFSFMPKDDETTESPSWCTQVVERVAACSTVLTSLGYTIKHKYVIWWQGESDGDEFTPKEVYKERLNTIAEKYKTGGIENMFIIRIGNYNSSSNTHLYDEIQDAQTELCRDNDFYVMASLKSSGLQDMMNDAYHFNQTAYNIIGADTAKNIAYYYLFGEEATQYDNRTGLIYPYFKKSQSGRPVLTIKGAEYILPSISDLDIIDRDILTFQGASFANYGTDLTIEGKYKYLTTYHLSTGYYVALVTTEKAYLTNGQIHINSCTNGWMGYKYKLIDGIWSIDKFYNIGDIANKIIDHQLDNGVDLVNYDMYSNSTDTTIRKTANYSYDVDYSSIVTTYTVTSMLTNASNSNSATSAVENSSYSATITGNTGYDLDTVIVTMNEVDITDTVYNNGIITIPKVTGNIVITANAIAKSCVVTKLATNCIISGDDIATYGSSYSATLTANNGYTLNTPIITMGELTLNDVYLNGIITIPSVTDNITITATATETDSIINATGITLSPTTIIFDTANDTSTITATLEPSNTTDTVISWISSDTNVATVTNGVVKAVANGSATITATTSNNLTSTVSVTVNIKDSGDQTSNILVTNHPEFQYYYDNLQQTYPYIVAFNVDGASGMMISSVKPTSVIYGLYSYSGVLGFEDVYSNTKIYTYSNTTESWSEITSTAYKIKLGNNSIGFKVGSIGNTTDAVMIAIEKYILYSTEDIYEPSDENDLTSDWYVDGNKGVIIHRNDVDIYAPAYNAICTTYPELKLYYDKLAEKYPYFTYNGSFIAVYRTKPDFVCYSTYNYNKYTIVNKCYSTSNLYKLSSTDDAYTITEVSSNAYKVSVPTTPASLGFAINSDVSVNCKASTENIYAGTYTMGDDENVLAYDNSNILFMANVE